MDRREALLGKIFESAMKGNAPMQRFLYKEFERNDERIAAARVRFEQLQFHWIINNPNLKRPDYEIPIEVELEMLGLQSLLHHYFPNQYPPVQRPRDRDDGEREDD